MQTAFIQKFDTQKSSYKAAKSNATSSAVAIQINQVIFEELLSTRT